VDGTTSVDVLADLSRRRASASTSVRGMTVPDHAGIGTLEHTTGTGFSPELSANEVHGEVELCVLISS